MLRDDQPIDFCRTHNPCELDDNLPCGVRLEDERPSEGLLGSAGCCNDIQVIEHELAVDGHIELALPRCCQRDLGKVEIDFMISRGHQSSKCVIEVTISIRLVDGGGHPGRDPGDGHRGDRSGRSTAKVGIGPIAACRRAA